MGTLGLSECCGRPFFFFFFRGLRSSRLSSYPRADAANAGTYTYSAYSNDIQKEELAVSW